jgi:predicted NBD/HSP70 family sugar kinase
MSLLEPFISADLLSGVADESEPDVPMLAATVWLESPMGLEQAPLVFPVPVSVLAEQRIARYLASEANNLAVVSGGTRLHITCPGQISPAKVTENIERHYSQVHQLLTSSAAITASTELPAWDDRTARPIQETREVLPLLSGRTAVGVNVGQTDTKVVVATAAGIRDGFQWRTRTFPGDLPRGRGLAVRVAAAVEAAVGAAGGNVDSIGLALGGIVRAAVVDRSSGVALGLDDEDYEALVDLPRTMGEHHRTNVSMVQDVEAKAYYHAASGHARDCLVLDLGTSLGGAYIDPRGAIPPYLNQIGRIAFDLDDASVPRTDGCGDGLLSQYVSARGIVSLAATTGTAITSAVELERLQFPPSRPSEQHLLRLLRDRIKVGVALATQWYRPATIMLSGGVVSGRFGAAVRTWLDELEAYEVTLSRNPLFDGCIGAAWMALNEATNE